MPVYTGMTATESRPKIARQMPRIAMLAGVDFKRDTLLLAQNVCSLLSFFLIAIGVLCLPVRPFAKGTFLTWRLSAFWR